MCCVPYYQNVRDTKKLKGPTYSAALDQGIVKPPASKQAKSPSHDIVGGIIKRFLLL